MDTTASQSISKAGVRRGLIRWIVQMVAGLLVFETILFLVAGSLDWPAGWAYLGLNALILSL